MKYKICLICAALLLIALPIAPPAHALIASSEIKKDILMKDWLTEMEFKATKQRIASERPAYRKKQRQLNLC